MGLEASWRMRRREKNARTDQEIYSYCDDPRPGGLEQKAVERKAGSPTRFMCLVCL